MAIQRLIPFRNVVNNDKTGQDMKLLVIDDDPDIRQLLSKTFIRWGHEVDCMGHGDDVVPYCAKHLKEYDLVLLDVVLPGMNGTGLYRWLREMDEEVRIILITGFGQTEKVKAVLDEGAELLPKPFDAATLRDVVINGTPAIKASTH